MRILNQQITSYVSTNLLSPYSAWASGTTYAQGNIVLYQNYHYKSMVNSNLGVTPSDDTGKWLLWEVSNIYASLDLQSSTETICNASTIASGTNYDLALVANVNGFDYLALGNMKGTQVTIVEKDATTATLATTVKTITNGEMSYVLPLQATANTAEITITDLPSDGYSSIGSVIGGVSVSIGDTNYDPKFGFSSDITQTIDPSGIVSIETTDVEELIDVNVIFDSTDAIQIKRELKNIKGVMTSFILDETVDSIYENIFVVGIIDDFTIVLSNPTKTWATVSIQEVL